jgi:hypothetical protein
VTATRSGATDTIVFVHCRDPDGSLIEICDGGRAT